MPGVVAQDLTKVFRHPDGRPHVAVDRISVSIEPASAVSVIGPNGAGKSTLLRLVAGLLAPTSGTVRRSGRTASLIEMGAGLHPDLTVAENAELGLALAGFGRAERRRRRDVVVEFAGLTGVVDRPLKHLSTGMLARLSSATAVHTDPEVLLCDEVLAVGDDVYQRELLIRVGELVRDGAAVVLVTHSLELAALATSRTIWIDRGAVIDDGPAPDVLERYERSWHAWSHDLGARGVAIRHLRVTPEAIQPGGPLVVAADLQCSEDVGDIDVRLEVRQVVGDEAWMRSPGETPEVRRVNLVASSTPTTLPRLALGTHHVELSIDRVPISPSKVELSLVVSDRNHRVLDEVASELRVGDDVRRPHYHLEVVHPEVVAPPSG